MEIDFEISLPILRRTPSVVRALLGDLDEAWTTQNEGPGTWSPFDVVVHLIHGECVNWVPRIEHLLHHGEAVAFPPFDREASFAASRGIELDALLTSFAESRKASLDRLDVLALADAHRARTGRHPEFGVVTLGQLLATWVAHDLSHIAQIVRVMARQTADAVGPWRAYLPLVRDA